MHTLCVNIDKSYTRFICRRCRNTIQGLMASYDEMTESGLNSNISFRLE